MAENKLEIILEAIDNATAEIKKVKASVDDINKSTKEVVKTTEEAGKTIKQQFKEAGKELRDFRKTVFLVTAALAVVISTTKEAAKYSLEAKKTYDEFDISIKTLSATVGQILGPAMEGVAFVVRVLTDTIEAAVAGFIKLSSFIAEFFFNLSQGPVEAFRRAMEVSTEATDNFLEKIEETRQRVGRAFTLEKEMKEVDTLEKLTVKAAKVMRQSWDGVIGAMDQLGASLSAASEMGRDWARAAAIVALGLAIVHTAAGVTRAFEDYPWPFSMAVAGIVAAAGAIQIATISAQKFAQGGRPPVGVPSLIGERGPELFIPDMAGTIIPNNRLGSYGSKTISIQNNIYNPVVRSDEDIDKLTEEISLRLARESERL